MNLVVQLVCHIVSHPNL
uniref:Uncharacterized protein n=1 Tax=Rhizophora mucronata TaxID=61149 RepID=A0A2P2N1G8_RHIMU